MKRSSRLTETEPETVALKFENGILKTKLAECTKMISAQSKNIDGLRIKNAEFAKKCEETNLITRSYVERMSDLSREHLIVKANYSKLKHKVETLKILSSQMRKTFVLGTNQILDIYNLLGEETDSDLTLGAVDTANSTTANTASTSKSNLKVLPTISGHTIQKPTISLSKSDSQQINYLLQHQNDIQNDVDTSQLTHSLSNNLSNVSENTNENDLEDITITDGQQISPNDDLHSIENENLSEETDNFDKRLSTVLEMSQESMTNSINIISNILAGPSANSSANSSTSGTSSSSFSFTRNKKRASIMPSPIDTSCKMLRPNPLTNNLTSNGNSSSRNTSKKSVSNISRSTRASSSLVTSAILYEDPVEGPSTLLDGVNDLSTSTNFLRLRPEGDESLKTSTPMDVDKKKFKRNSAIGPELTEFVTTRNTKRRAKKSYVDNKVNISRSLNDLSNVDDEPEDNKPESPKRITRYRRLTRKSVIDMPLTKQNSSTEKLNSSDNEPNDTTENVVNSSSEERTPKRVVPNKKAGPKKKPTAMKTIQPQILTRNRKSRSYSPNYRLQNANKNVKEVPTEINPTVQLVRLLEPQQRTSRNKRRSRSFSPARSETSEKSNTSEASTRSSSRMKNIVNYNEPSLKVKVRRL